MIEPTESHQNDRQRAWEEPLIFSDVNHALLPGRCTLDRSRVIREPAGTERERAELSRAEQSVWPLVSN